MRTDPASLGQHHSSLEVGKFDAIIAGMAITPTCGDAIWRRPRLLDGSVSKVGAFIRISGGVGLTASP